MILYMPPLPETVIAMLAVAKIGAVHSSVFAGFSAKSLRARIEDAQARCIITVDGLLPQRTGWSTSNPWWTRPRWGSAATAPKP